MQSSLKYTPIETEYIMLQYKTLKKWKIRSSQVAGLTDGESSTQCRAKIIGAGNVLNCCSYFVAKGSAMFSVHKSNCLTAASFFTSMLVIYH
ncbi:hypothetical protein EUGRSUZ_B03686 [Eucalyptus grandis]|uniref:Uncharacterized protein n=2 Tax=Eucalyptus grandis TaxID=71139 RepID=A0ACC3LXE9_EUCGR|nr:hypothetical protein EUGRSUZ_B03686 [Eucalyptus grandis]